MNAKERYEKEVVDYGKGRGAWYREVYLHSAHWLELKVAKLSAHGKRCGRCTRTTSLQIHHKEYRSIYDVELSDLEVLCRECHTKAHKLFERDGLAYEMVIIPESKSNHWVNPPGSSERNKRRRENKARNEKQREKQIDKAIAESARKWPGLPPPPRDIFIGKGLHKRSKR